MGTLHAKATEVSGEVYGTDTYLVSAYMLALDSWPDPHKPLPGGVSLGVALAEIQKKPSDPRLSLSEQRLIQVINDQHGPEPVMDATTNAVRLCWKSG
ncbi:hypothetical protein KGD82_16235 [Nocardiopsis eucommiae]|uniref:Uncharacterized protein n=1 Tax=Nocardiopsis eucommiae TaxID=2831970 RepID=A0A975L6Z3_9ACTN|nr:hypothetical protein KGD82_16235 [Nocardiopsis eucommiae]